MYNKYMMMMMVVWKKKMEYILQEISMVIGKKIINYCYWGNLRFSAHRTLLIKHFLPTAILIMMWREFLCYAFPERKKNVQSKAAAAVASISICVRTVFTLCVPHRDINENYHCIRSSELWNRKKNTYSVPL